jgi:hypothetical protein
MDGAATEIVKRQAIRGHGVGVATRMRLAANDLLTARVAE